MDSWTCGGGVRLNEAINATSLDLVVAHASAVFCPAGSSPIPEPSTWAMLALGFLGFGGIGLRKRKRRTKSGYGNAFLDPVSADVGPGPGGRGRLTERPGARGLQF